MAKAVQINQEFFEMGRDELEKVASRNSKRAVLAQAELDRRAEKRAAKRASRKES